MTTAPSTPVVRAEPAGRISRPGDVRYGSVRRVAGAVGEGRSGQIPVSESARVCRWPVAWLVMESGSCNDLDGENQGDEPVDGGAKRRPPPGAGNVVAALLPEVFETMARVAEDEEPGRPGDARGGKQDERASDGAFDGDHLGPSVCHREPDVDRCDQGEQESLDGCLSSHRRASGDAAWMAPNASPHRT